DVSYLLFEALYGSEAEDWLKEHILFLDAKDESLVSRYKETRRSHLLAVGGLPLNGIQQEREILDELRGRAQRIIDTTDLKPKELREKIVKVYTEEKKEQFYINIDSLVIK